MNQQQNLKRIQMHLHLVFLMINLKIIIQMSNPTLIKLNSKMHSNNSISNKMLQMNYLKDRIMKNLSISLKILKYIMKQSQIINYKIRV